MQKVRVQIFLTFSEMAELHQFMVENRCKNESQAISQMLILKKRLQKVIENLERKAQESELWKERANNRLEKSIKDTDTITN